VKTQQALRESAPARRDICIKEAIDPVLVVKQSGSTRRAQRRGMVKTKLPIVAILALGIGVSVQSADSSDVKGVLEKFESVRPQEAELVLYQLDWMPSLKAAKEKAAREERPIFLVVVTNSFGDFYTGHC
jgi:hypothetical protein